MPFDLGYLNCIDINFTSFGSLAVHIETGLLSGQPYGGTAILIRRRIASMPAKNEHEIKPRWKRAQLINAYCYCKSKNNKILSAQQSHTMYAVLNAHISNYSLRCLFCFYI